ncbi:acetyl esterase [Pseudomonas sp. URIL14HWK12:I9]|nr:acetyl esterase [Pseudomonas sp. URIL14HWK12:I12]PVZ22298.1 acetyl esterase [Pseudomonas sp. URIL14HWK12:I10]PVZ31578.1 acetyl esterase [Pseudomonas sp. URIL14HWK12:I11]SNZ16575.1 acetyl esterase [Pseudomonas sp. URIL14HWK12:I9]
MQALVDKTLAFACPAGTSLAEQRAAYARMAAAFTPPPPAGLEQRSVRLASGLALRCYRPLAAEPAAGWPGLLYLHGGGWMVGGLDSHDFICRPLALALQAQVVAVDYRLAPEAPYPAALEDTLEAWHWLTQAQGFDPSRLAVGGDSAGGNLAAALCLALRGRPGPQPRSQALIYPLLGPGGDGSWLSHAHAPLLSADDVLQCLAAYLPTQAHRTSPLALPLLAPSLEGLPPAWVAVAEHDPLHDDGVRYTQRTGGILVEGPGMLHGALRALDDPCIKRWREAMVKHVLTHWA